MKDFQEDIENSLEELRRGGVILYPTDTVWGLGADALNQDAVEKIFAIKGRPHEKSPILLLSDVGQLCTYVENLPTNIAEILGGFEGPTTVIYPEAKNLPKNVVHSDGSVALRITQEPFSKALIDSLQRPLVSTSANISGSPTPPTFAEINPAIKNNVDYVVEYRQDDLSGATPSRIVRLNRDGSLAVVRE